MVERSVNVDLKGREKQPVVVIDNMCADPQALQELAFARDFVPVGQFYPGIRAPVPKSEYAALFSPLSQVLRGVFGYGAGARVEECYFSLVTSPPGALAPIQRLPHYDGVEGERIAVLLYLCPPEHGGTAFYRHKRTGFETVDDARFETFKTTLEADVREHGLPANDYIQDDTAIFERISGYGAAFNRMLVYRGINLHSADIARDFDFSANPREGRLTLNAFLMPAAAP